MQINHNTLTYLPTLETMPPDAKVWIYQSNRSLTPTEIDTLRNKVELFVSSWQSHGHPLVALGLIIYEYFIVFIVDERASGVSGCSIDSSVHFVKSVEQELGIDLFNRMNFAYKIGVDIALCDQATLTQLYHNGLINDETIVFNNLVATKQDFEQHWETPLGQCWIKNFIT